MDKQQSIVDGQNPIEPLVIQFYRGYEAEVGGAVNRYFAWLAGLRSDDFGSLLHYSIHHGGFADYRKRFKQNHPNLDLAWMTT